MKSSLVYHLKRPQVKIKNEISASTEFEHTAITLLFTLVIIGIALYYKNIPAYRSYVGEDRIVEWLTAIALFICFIISIKRFFQLISLRSFRFLLFLILFSFMFLFGVGEEISWGQRIFDVQSPDFFLTYNSQNETNIHNLIFNNIRINKLIFSFLLGIIVFLYIFVLPFLYNRKEKIRNLIDSIALPIPSNYHIFRYIILIIMIGIFNAPDKWEL